MTITLTSEELRTFEAELAKWYSGMVGFVLANIAANFHLQDFDHRVTSAEIVNKWRKRYEEENPKPTWKDLLPN